MALPDGVVTVVPGQQREHVIRGELHTISDGDRLRTGFRVGDSVTVQGQWQPQPRPALIEVTGITSADQITFMVTIQAHGQEQGA
jgi:hypothetical protein